MIIFIFHYFGILIFCLNFWDIIISLSRIVEIFKFVNILLFPISIVLFSRLKIGVEDACLIDSGITHIILKNEKYFFSQLNVGETSVITINSSSKLIEGSRRANILLLGYNHD